MDKQFEKDLKSKMIPADTQSFEQVEQLLLKKLSGILDISKLVRDTYNNYIVDNVHHFGFDCSEGDIIIFYPSHDFEHTHFMGMDYDTVEKWTNAAYEFIALFINKTVRYEYYYQGKTHIRTKIISLDNVQETEIENFFTSCHFLKIISKKQPRIETFEISFKQQ